MELLNLAKTSLRSYCLKAYDYSGYVFVVKIKNNKIIKASFDKYLDGKFHYYKTRIICRDGYDVLHFHGSIGYGHANSLKEDGWEFIKDFELRKLNKSIVNYYNKTQRKNFDKFLSSTKVYTHNFNHQITCRVENIDFEHPKEMPWGYSDDIVLDYEDDKSREAREQRKKENFINYLHTVGSYRI